MDTNRMKADAVIFDKDGTLMDFDAFWVSVSVAAIRFVLRQLEQDEAMAGEILEAFGVHNGKTDMNGILCKGTYTDMAEVFCTTMGNYGCKTSPHTLEKLFREAYGRHAKDGEVQATCAHLRDVLLSLKKSKKLAVVTTDDEQVTRFCLNALGIADVFDKIYTDNGEMPTKPYPDCIFDFCRSFGVSRGNIVMVGDTMTDVLFARNANVRMIGVANSEKKKQLLRQETDVVIHDISELLNILK